ncbi:type IV pilin protein [uncultured Psychrobacter sp.]|uniref:type IV pilin protein n=1 Tax=uncultured Psychrobacter sp. TaxID=259303 RepID=UPI00260B712D|nr:prepilin-type N-terminal cleavage/methylation domain-containing protein [uncultured Psychrobacter sp.]
MIRLSVLQRTLSHERTVRYQYPTSQTGFTLIEVMIVVVVLAILAAIAVPSYRRYIIVNAERDAQAKMQQLQLELERWRASALTYKGFIPQTVDSDGDTKYSYADTANTIINVPEGSGDDYTYRITLVDGDTSGTPKSLVTNAGVDNVTGRTWKMLAVPNPNRYIKNGSKIMFTSSGIRCMTTSSLTIKSENCGNDAQEW